HASCLHLSRHIAQKSLERRQPSCGLFEQSDEKSDGAICAPELISAYQGTAPAAVPFVAYFSICSYIT
ncbi:MAG: hypothetical protein IJK23_05500, partial [Clostridia bacterium]|nr:hypothetical protein [Clostridia bacterium]